MRMLGISGLLFVAAMLIPYSTLAADADITPYDVDVKVQVNDYLVDFPDAQPFKDERDRVQVPVRFVSEYLGYQVEWVKTEQEIELFLIGDAITIHMRTGSPEVRLNGEPIELDTAPVLSDQRVYVPLRFLAEVSEYDVSWDKQNSLAIVHPEEAVAAPVWTAPKWTVLEDVRASAYTAAADENGGWIGRDYMGNSLSLGTVAVDPDVIPLGSTLYIEGYNHASLPVGGMTARATDIGGAVKGKKIDIFIPDTRKSALKFGIQTVKVYILQE